MKSSIVIAIAAKIDIGIGISVDAYMLSDGTLRYGQEYIGLLLGYSKGYISQLGKKSVKKLQALYRRGFTGDVIHVKVSRPRGGSTRASTLSFDDFCILIEFEALEVKNPKAAPLLTSSFREIVVERTCVAFGLPELTPEEKQQLFSNNYNSYLDRIQDEEDLWIPGDTWERPDLCDWEDYRELANVSELDRLAEFYANCDFDESEISSSAFTRIMRDNGRT